MVVETYLLYVFLTIKHAECCIPRVNYQMFQTYCYATGASVSDISTEDVMDRYSGVAEHLFQGCDYRAETVTVQWGENRECPAVAFHIQYAI